MLNDQALNDPALSDQARWNLPAGKESRKTRLWQRQQIIRAIREDLYSQEFLEVETPLLVKGTCPDVHIESVQTADGYLVTSTEYQIKRMVVGGFKRLFTLTKNFRAHDRGRYHSSEFTMLEWARAESSHLHSIEEDAVRFIRKAFRALYPTANSVQFNGHEIDIMDAPWERLTVREAFKKHLGLNDLGDFSLEPLLQACKKAKLALPPGFDQDKYLIMSYLFEQLNSFLGRRTPTFLQEWPAYLTTSAPIYAHDASIAERSELYIAGIEIADGFPFLTDAKLQRGLFNQELAVRKQNGKPPVVIDQKFFEALDLGMPQGAGMALGIDRLVMALTGSTQLSDIQAFSWDEV